MTDELKKALESAVTDEQKKAVAEKFKEEIQKLDPEELDKIAGGNYKEFIDGGNPIIIEPTSIIRWKL